MAEALDAGLGCAKHFGEAAHAASLEMCLARLLAHQVHDYAASAEVGIGRESHIDRAGMDSPLCDRVNEALRVSLLLSRLCQNIRLQGQVSSE